MDVLVPPEIAELLQNGSADVLNGPIRQVRWNYFQREVMFLSGNCPIAGCLIEFRVEVPWYRHLWCWLLRKPLVTEGPRVML